ncbi:zinc finger and SCAN domain containing protein 4C-like [Peromyscus eremicus]|uniref:zinc finger and SCAN domain containing protein 4C-like n=1 Tax=Peromyscus eremicus TaxID=42410 RepID=UPI0027DB8B17|nr:zinc finger and SCAN domain containing protein 4C-like [Peromyscus eremicus]
MEFIPTQVSPVQWEEGISNSPIAQLNFPQNDSVSCAKQELQALWETFNSWLQPEKQSKEQMISQLVLKEFLITGKFKDKFAFKEKWESSDRNMGRFMEGLTDEYLKPPVMVHIAMQGQKALFSETMSLKEAINLLKEQQSSRSSTQENARTPFPVSQDMLLKTGHEDNEDGQNNPWSTRDVNGGNSSPGNQIDSLIIIQREQFPEPEDRRVSYKNPHNYSRTSQVTSRYQEESQKETPPEDGPMEVQSEIISRLEQTEDFQIHDANSTFESHQDRLHRDPKTYKWSFLLGALYTSTSDTADSKHSLVSSSHQYRGS